MIRPGNFIIVIDNAAPPHPTDSWIADEAASFSEILAIH